MAGGALMGSRLVEQGGIVFDLAGKFVAVPAWNIHVASFQREIRPCLVVK